MVFIKIYAKDERIKYEILDWMIGQLRAKDDVSLMDLIRQYIDDVLIDDNDMLSYWDVGWNVLDLLKLYKAKSDSDNLEIPRPKYPFLKHYT